VEAQRDGSANASGPLSVSVRRWLTRQERRPLRWGSSKSAIQGKVNTHIRDSVMEDTAERPGPRKSPCDDSDGYASCWRLVRNDRGELAPMADRAGLIACATPTRRSPARRPAGAGQERQAVLMACSSWSRRIRTPTQGPRSVRPVTAVHPSARPRASQPSRCRARSGHDAGPSGHRVRSGPATGRGCAGGAAP